MHRVMVLLSMAFVCLGIAGPASFRVTAEATTPVDARTPTEVVSPTAAPAPQSERDFRLQPEVLGSAIDVVAAEAAGVSPDVLHLALTAVSCGVTSGALDAPPTLTLIDYSKPSVEPRLWVFDLRTGDMLFRELVAHGKNTGDNLAEHFSDAMNSRQSSIGLFRTADTYIGGNGYSLRLDGLEPGFNAHARERAIVMHGAPYVDASFAAAQGRLGRSWGCPALRTAIAAKVIDTIRGGGVIFSYYPDSEWLRTSRFLNCGSTGTNLLATR